MLTVDVMLLIAAAVLTGALLLFCGWPLPISRSLTGALAVIMAVVGLGLMLLVFKDASMKVNTQHLSVQASLDTPRLVPYPNLVKQRE